MTDASLPVPHEDWTDKLRTLLLSSLGGAPGVGGPASGLVAILWQGRYSRRLEEFLSEVARLLDQISGDVDDIEQRLQSDVVISVGLTAAAAAGRTPDREKRRLLANCLVNTVSSDRYWAARDALAMMLIQRVDELSTAHIMALDVLSAPRKKAPVAIEASKPNPVNLRSVLVLALPTFNVDEAAAYGILSDLENRGLVATSGSADPDAVLTFDDLDQGLASALGRRLLEYVRDPES